MDNDILECISERLQLRPCNLYLKKGHGDINVDERLGSLKGLAWLELLTALAIVVFIERKTWSGILKMVA